jgi:hypothetical protein
MNRWTKTAFALLVGTLVLTAGCDNQAFLETAKAAALDWVAEAVTTVLNNLFPVG